MLRSLSATVAAALTLSCAAVHESRDGAREPASHALSPSAPALRTNPSAPDVADTDTEADAHTMPVAIDGTDLVRGRSTVTVTAPIERVRESVLDFAHYPDFMPHYTKCRLLGRTSSGGRDVYMEVEALHGAVRIWARVEVAKSTSADGVETYDSKFLEGNVKDFKAVWRLRKIDDGHTELSLEVFLHPNLPLPKNMVNEQNLEKSALGVLAMRTRAEGSGTK